MSYFSLAVISKHPEDVEQLLAPYQETSEGPFAEFVDETMELLDQYENHTVPYLIDSRGDLILNNRYGFNKLKNEGEPVLEIAFKDYYRTFEEFVEDYFDDSYSNLEGRYGYYSNPNAKWDWWVVGGRWSGDLASKDGTYEDLLQLKDLDMSLDQETYQDSILFWEESVEPEDSDYPFRKCYINQWPSKEDYAREQATFSTYALLTEDGEWHEPGQVGYFGSSSATEKSTAAFKTFLQEYIEQSDPEYYITLVDCHI